MQDTKKILLIEDDLKLAILLKEYFERQGFSFEIETSSVKTEARIESFSPDLIVLDLMLPERDGLSVCRDIRKQFAGIILMLTASNDDMDQVAALEMGADDFVTKPIQPRVLLARIRMLLRRNEQKNDVVIESSNNDNILTFNGLWINNVLKRCKLNDEVIALTITEFEVLWYLARNAGSILSRDDLLQSLRGLEYDGLNRTIDNKIAKLRKKLKDDVNSPKKIITVRGQGYIFDPGSW